MTILPVTVRRMVEGAVKLVERSLLLHAVKMNPELVRSWWVENVSESRVSLLALYDNVFLGWGHIVFKPEYADFRDYGIPEIRVDVIPHYRHRGIGTRLLNSVEEEVFKKFGYEEVGIALKLAEPYGDSQRMYVKHGYVPDGKGVIYDKRSTVRYDDAEYAVGDLAIFLTKQRPD